MSATPTRRPMRRCRLLGLGLLAGAVMCAGIIVAGTATAAEPSAVGWWRARQPSDTFPLLVAPVPGVPEGGFYVSGDLRGPSGVSALRFEPEANARMEALTITVADTAGSPVVEACAASEAWEAAAGGPWDERPTPDCDAARAVGVLSDDGRSVRFDLLAFAGFVVLDVVLLPGVDPDTDQRAAFSTSFEPPDAESLTVVSDPQSSTDPASPGAPPPPAGRGEGTASLATPPPRVGPFTTMPSAAPLPEEGPPQDAVPAPSVRSTPAFGVPASEEFAYAAVFALPLVLLGLGSYLGFCLTRPVAPHLRFTKEPW